MPITPQHTPTADRCSQFMPAPQTPQSGVPSADGVAVRGAGQVSLFIRYADGCAEYVGEWPIRRADATQHPLTVVPHIIERALWWNIAAALTVAWNRVQNSPIVDTDEDFDADELPVCDCDREAWEAQNARLAEGM